MLCLTEGELRKGKSGPALGRAYLLCQDGVLCLGFPVLAGYDRTAVVDFGAPLEVEIRVVLVEFAEEYLWIDGSSDAHADL